MLKNLMQAISCKEFYVERNTETNTSKYFKELIFNTLLFSDDQFIVSDTEDYLKRAVYLL